MCPALFISDAQISVSYNKIVRDITTDNIIFMNVIKAAESANIADIFVVQAPGPRWNVVLEAWYQQTTDSFCNNNPDWISQNALLIQKNVGLRYKMQMFCSKIEGLEDRVDIQSSDKAVIELAINNYQVQTAKIVHFLK